MRMPRAVGFSPDGTLVYVLDRTQRLQVFTPEGSFVRGWATPHGTRGNPRGLDVAPDGSIYVADTHNNQVIVYSPEGRELRRWGKRGTRPGELAVVTDVAVDWGESGRGKEVEGDRGGMGRSPELFRSSATRLAGTRALRIPRVWTCQYGEYADRVQ